MTTYYQKHRDRIIAKQIAYAQRTKAARLAYHQRYRQYGPDRPTQLAPTEWEIVQEFRAKQIRME